MEPFVVEFQPAGTRLACQEPILALDAAARAGVQLKSVCGGKATCGKCLVRVTAAGAETAAVSPVTESERLLLSEAEIAAGYRQACRALLSGDAYVYVPPSSALEEQRVQVEGAEGYGEVEADPAVREFLVSVPPATLADQRGDFERTATAVGDRHGVMLERAGLAALTQLTSALRAADWEVTVAVRDGELIASQPRDKTGSAVGLAVDLGTTKIACYLVDLVTGHTMAAWGVMNPQIAHGEDVISRLAAAGRDEVTRRNLQECVIATINDTAADLCAGAGVAPSEILEMVIAGNTAMHHLALGLPTEQLSVVPFVPATTRPLDVKCAALGFAAAPGAYAHFPPPIAGFVGSDHVAVLVASGFGRDARTLLAVDLGTNTEVALQARGRIRSCSTACGPAFEGAHIKYGMRAAPGAIEHVSIDPATGQVKLATVGAKPPVGICGSGILDAVAGLLAAGWLNRRGRLAAGSPGVRRGADGVEFVLAEGCPHPAGGARECQVAGEAPCAPACETLPGAPRQVVLTQRDLDEVQLAKGAIRAGIDILMEDMSVRPGEVDQVIIAGAFGTYLDPANAVRIGLFPPVPLPRFRQVGNAAGTGARAILVSRRARAEATKLAGQVDYLELTLHPDFALRFAHGMWYEPAAPPDSQGSPAWRLSPEKPPAPGSGRPHPP